eukprot:TRINITY_DN28304_c0_g1_i1.p1 TRINITY_DN28304_c0_g1~~TRINITY_DN28304_c0_g1_i1.p1  ORF type:complete len:244 (-),score=38.21 TRINITY_DN28304_c0_g1_i1:40-771(-)
MFVLSLIEDTLILPPKSFDDEIKTLTNMINKKYANKVIMGVGLGITLKQIVWIGPTFLFEGSATLQVRFTFIVFRPFKGEIIEGKIKDCDKTYIQISLGFFDQVYIEPNCLRSPYSYDANDKIFYWAYKQSDGGQMSAMYYEINEPIRFRVIEVRFRDVASKMKRPPDPEAATEGAVAANVDDVEEPMMIFGSVVEDGLGMVRWWVDEEEVEPSQQNGTYDDFWIRSGRWLRYGSVVGRRRGS